MELSLETWKGSMLLIMALALISLLIAAYFHEKYKNEKEKIGRLLIFNHSHIGKSFFILELYIKTIGKNDLDEKYIAKAVSEIGGAPAFFEICHAHFYTFQSSKCKEFVLTSKQLTQGEEFLFFLPSPSMAMVA